LALLEGLSERFDQNLGIWERLATAYIQSKRADDAVRCYLAMHDIHEASRRYDLAKADLEKAVAARPGDVDILRRLGEICLRLNQRPEGLGYLGMAAARFKETGQFEDARAIIERIIKIDPTNLENRRMLGSVCEAMSDLAGAVKHISLAARGWAERRQHAEAIAAFEHLLGLDPGLSDEREAYAHVLEREGRVDEASDQYMILVQNLGAEADPRQVIRYCRQILKDRPDHVEAHLCLFRVFDQTNKPRLALEEAQWLADYYISAGEMDEAESYIRRGLALAPGEIELRKRYVDILIETERIDEAAVNLSELASSAQAQGDVRTARWALSRACEVRPENLDYRHQLVQLLETAGELAEARSARIGILRVYLERGESDKARSTAERVVESAPNDEELRSEIARIFEEAGISDVAALHYTQVARHAFEQERYPKAIEVANHVLVIKPYHIPARECLVEACLATGESADAAAHSRELYNLYLENDDTELAQRCLKVVIQHRPSDPEPRRLMVNLNRRMGRLDMAAEQLRRLAEICANEGDVPSAVKALGELLEIRPDDTRARARYIDLYSQVGDESELYDDYLQLAIAYRKESSVVEALQVYEKLLAMDPGRTEAREQLVEFLFDQGQINRGVEEARVLVDLYLKQNLKVEAARILEKSLAKSPNDTQMRHQLATLQIRTNRRGLALETLRGLLKQYEQSGDKMRQVTVIIQILEIDDLNVDLRQRLAELWVALDQPEKAREQRMLLAKQYLDRQLFDLAEREYQRVLAVDPHDPEVWQAKIQTHLQIGGEEEVIPDMNSLAEAFGHVGKLKEAVAVYKKLREMKPQDIPILRKYIEAYSQVGDEQDLEDDYLQLATLLSQQGDVAGALKIYQRVQMMSPDNSTVRVRIRESELAGAGGSPSPSAPKPSKAAQDFPLPTSRTEKGPVQSAPQRPAPALAGSSSAGSEAAAGESQLEKRIREYENILKLNPDNPTVRSKLAELIAKTGRMKEADEQWAQAARDFMAKGHIDRGVEILQELVQRYPEDGRLRERLSRAVLKRESLDAIGSVADIPVSSGDHAED
jgi:tetratricopeptide (TPR) repeat protein